MLLWIVAFAGCGTALLALAYAHRLSARLTQLTAMYWELKFGVGELKAQIGPSSGESVPAPSAPAPAAFVPLDAIKRRPS